MQADREILQKVIVLEDALMALEMNLASKSDEGTFGFWTLPDDVDQRKVATTLITAACFLLPNQFGGRLVEIARAVQDDITANPDLPAPIERENLTAWPF